MVPTGANGGVLGFEKKMMVDQERGSPNKRCLPVRKERHTCQFCGTVFIDLCCLRLCSVGPLCLIKETFAFVFPNITIVLNAFLYGVCQLL